MLKNQQFYGDNSWPSHLVNKNKDIVQNEHALQLFVH